MESCFSFPRGVLHLFLLSNGHIAIGSARFSLLVSSPFSRRSSEQTGFHIDFWFCVFVPARARGILHMSNKVIPQVSTLSTLDVVWSWKCLPNSYNATLPNLRIVRFDSSLNLLIFPYFPKSATIDSVWYWDRSLSTNSWIFIIILCSSSTASCGMPWMLRSTLIGFSSATGFPVLVGVPWCCSATGFPVLHSVPCSSCCCCCTCQAYLRTIFGAGRDVETLWSQVVSPCRIHHLFDAVVGRHWIVNNNGARPCLPKLKTFFLCPGQVDPVDDVLMRLPFTRPRWVVVEFFCFVSKNV